MNSFLDIMKILFFSSFGIREFIVYYIDGEKDMVKGCCGLSILREW